MTTVVAIVPAKDRQDSIAATVEALRRLHSIDRVLVVDDGSTDDTTYEARQAGAQVLRLARNVGKGDAIAAGVALADDADVYVLIDADVGADAVQAEVLLRPVLADEADLVIGVLPAAGKRGGFGTIRRFATWGIRRASGVEVRAALSGQRAVKAEHLRGLIGASRFGLEVAMTIDTARAGGRVLEVDVPMEHRHTGRSVAGFRHRAVQGADIVEALWPRVVPAFLRRSLLVCGVVGFLALTLVVSRATAVQSVPATERARHVVIFGIPHLGFDDLDPTVMPNLTRLSQRGATGMLTVRTGGGSASEDAYATLGAGYRVSAGRNTARAAARDEIVEGSPAIDVVERRSGKRPNGAVVVPDVARLLRGAGAHVDSRPGALGHALHEAGRTTAVVANSDRVDANGDIDRRAPAALAVVSSTGAVDKGDVSRDLLAKSNDLPFGVTADRKRILAAFQDVAPVADVTVVDPGETDRAAWYRPAMRKNAAKNVLAQALTRTDSILGSVAANLPPQTLLLIVGMSPPTSKAVLVPIVAVGAGVTPGRLESPSTGRPGLVALTDVAPTVLNALGVAVPPAMVGRPVQYHAVQPDLVKMRATNDLISNRDQVYPVFQTSFVYLQIFVYLFALVALLRDDTPHVVKRVLRFLVVALVSVPMLTFVLRLIPVTMSWGIGSTLTLYGLAGLLAWGVAGRGKRANAPIVAVAWLGFILLCLDLATGARLQVSSLLGYTPTVAARFTGIGNASYAVLAASTVIVVSWIVERSGRPRDALWPAAALGVVAVGVDAAPWLGADVGGILSLVPALGFLLILLSGRRLNWRTIGIALGSAVVILAGVVAYEAMQPPESRDHIGRFFLGGAGGGSFMTTIGRKLATNISVLMNSTWSYLIPLCLVVVGVIFVRWNGWRRTFPARSAARAGFLGMVAVALLGYALNDSGAVVAALVSVFVLAMVVLPALADDHRDDEVLDPI